MRQQTIFQHVQAEGGKCGRRAHKQNEQPAALTRHFECKTLLKALPIHTGQRHCKRQTEAHDLTERHQRRRQIEVRDQLFHACQQAEAHKQAETRQQCAFILIHRCAAPLFR